MKSQQKPDGYKNKSDEELYCIAKGLRSLPEEHVDLALKTLMERGFDMEKADERIDRLRRGEEDVTVVKERGFFISYYPLLIAFIAMVGFMYYLQYAQESPAIGGDSYRLEKANKMQWIFGGVASIALMFYWFIHPHRKK